jgi:hypothetical protein
MSILPSYTASGCADWSLIPPHMIGGLRRFIENGIGPGSFLTAVLCNDLRGACERADDENRDRLFQYVQFLYSYAPSECWGSPAKFDAWCKQGGLTARAA